MINQTRTALAISLALASLPATVFAEETTPDNEDQLVVTATGFAQERREAPVSHRNAVRHRRPSPSSARKN